MPLSERERDSAHDGSQGRTRLERGAIHRERKSERASKPKAKREKASERANQAVMRWTETTEKPTQNTGKSRKAYQVEECLASE